MEARPDAVAARRILGSACILVYVLHAVARARLGHAAEILWACHVGDLLVGAGLLAGAPRLRAIGLLWLAIGTPAWLGELASGGEIIPTSILTHMGGLACGIWAARTWGVARDSWWHATGALIALFILCRLVTPPSENVNMAFRVWERYRAHLPDSFLATFALALIAHPLAFWFIAQRFPTVPATIEKGVAR